MLQCSNAIRAILRILWLWHCRFSWQNQRSMLCRRESWRFGNLSIGYFHPMDLTLRLKPCTGR